MSFQYDVVAEDRGDYIYTKVGGSGRDIDIFVELAKPAIELCLNSAHKKLLLEDAIEDDWPPLMIEKLVAKFYKAGFDKLFVSVYIPVPERKFKTYFAGAVGRSIGMDVEVSIKQSSG